MTLEDLEDIEDDDPPMGYGEACEALHVPMRASPHAVRAAYKLWRSKWAVHKARAPFVYAGAVAKLWEARRVAEFGGHMVGGLGRGSQKGASEDRRRGHLIARRRQ